MPGQQLYAHPMLLNVDDIRFTQNTASKKFSNKRMPSLLNAMKELLLGTLSLDDFPPIRIAIRDCDGEFYSIDNRRLLIFKALRIKEINVTYINWTHEFDCKVAQNPIPDPYNERVTLDVQGIKKFRKEFVYKMFSEMGRHYMKGRNLKFSLGNLNYTLTPDGGINTSPNNNYVYEEEDDDDDDDDDNSFDEESDDNESYDDESDSCDSSDEDYDSNDDESGDESDYYDYY